MLKNIVLSLIPIITTLNCSNQPIYVFSPEKSQCITIWDEGNYKYVFNQEVKNIEEFVMSDESEFVKFDMSKVPELQKAIFVCWQTDSSKLEILCPKSEVITNTLNPATCKIRTAHQLDERGIPQVRKYHDDGCFELDFELNTIFPKGNAKIKEK